MPRQSSEHLQHCILCLVDSLILELAPPIEMWIQVRHSCSLLRSFLPKALSGETVSSGPLLILALGWRIRRIFDGDVDYELKDGNPQAWDRTIAEGKCLEETLLTIIPARICFSPEAVKVTVTNQAPLWNVSESFLPTFFMPQKSCPHHVCLVRSSQSFGQQLEQDNFSPN